jgi:cardiolipin synthase A/B
MVLLVHPDDGAAPVARAIDAAKQTLDLSVFRLSHPAVESALRAAVGRSVRVRALVAHANGSGKAAIRKLEGRIEDLGCVVSRSDDDLLRYHGKMLLVDGTRLYVLGCNLTRRDMERSRGLGVVVTRPRVVQEAARLFAADFHRTAYAPESGGLVVSPFNSRAALAKLIEGAERQLLIYDSRLTDRVMMGLLEKKALAGVEVRVLGKVDRKLKGVAVEGDPGHRLHVRAIIQDGLRLFVGSQSLRRPELDKRREIGVIVSDRKAVLRAIEVFTSDWSKARPVSRPPLRVAAPLPREQRGRERRREG